MKCRWPVVLSILAGFAIGNCRVAHVSPDGFRGLKWGAPVPAGWTLVGREEDLYGGMEIYQNSKEDLTFGGANVESIRYFFWQNRLLDVLVTFKGDSNQRQVLRVCEKQFGSGANHHWMGPKALISFEYTEHDGKGQLHMMSTVVLEAAEAFEMAHAKKGPRIAG